MSAGMFRLVHDVTSGEDQLAGADQPASVRRIVHSLEGSRDSVAVKGSLAPECTHLSEYERATNKTRVNALQLDPLWRTLAD